METNKRIPKVINEQAAELALLRIMFFALSDQIPDKAKFVREVKGNCEDQTIRTMFSGMPESFFSAFQSMSAEYQRLLGDD